MKPWREFEELPIEIKETLIACAKHCCEKGEITQKDIQELLYLCFIIGANYDEVNNLIEKGESNEYKTIKSKSRFN